MLDNKLDNILGSAEFSICHRVDSKELWEETFNKLLYKPVAYSNWSLDYQFAYQCGHGGQWRDISFIIFWGNKPTALWPLCLSHTEGQFKLTSQGLPVLPPIFIAECPIISRKRITKSCLNLAREIAIAADLKSWESGESFVDSIALSDWHTQSMAKDVVCDLRHELYVNLQLDISEIKSNFRKSYKSLIVSGSKQWTVRVLDRYLNNSVWQEFRNLHRKVSGRVTRSEETWDLHHQDIEHQRAILIWLMNSAGDMVGGGFFNFTSDEGLYAVAAYDRTLFDKPMGHVVQYQAIEEFKKHGIRWHKIGARPLYSNVPPPNDKEIKIGEFKMGFSTHTFPCYLLKHKVNYDEST